MKKFLILACAILCFQSVEANYDYICFTEEGDGEWSECGEGGFDAWDQTTGCRIYTGTRTQGAEWIWGNTREGCSGQRGFRGADIRSDGRDSPTFDGNIYGANGQRCYLGQNGESTFNPNYNYDLDCLLEAYAAEDRVDEQDCRDEVGGDPEGAEREEFIMCLVDTIEEFIVTDALLDLGDTPFLEEVCQFEQCDNLPPVCGSTFRDPFEWHNFEDFQGDDPLRCLLDETIGDGNGGDDGPNCTEENIGNSLYSEPGTTTHIDHLTREECLDAGYAVEAAIIQYSETGNYPVCAFGGLELLDGTLCGPNDCGCDGPGGNCWPDTTLYRCDYGPSGQEVFAYTGADQTFTVPDGVTEVRISVWGAGGGGSNDGAPGVPGGAGGYTEAILDVAQGETYTVIVGEGGKKSSGQRTYGGGGGGGGQNLGASGGGYSGIFDNDTPLIIAGGGGGVGFDPAHVDYLAGDGGGQDGVDAADFGPNPPNHAGGRGGTQTEGGTGGWNGDPAAENYIPGEDGASLQGGDGSDRADGGGGGGGGFFGGGGGMGADENAYGGGGGSGYCDANLTFCVTTAGNEGVPPEQDAPSYVDGIGQGVINNDGGSGFVVFAWGADVGGGGATGGFPGCIDNFDAEDQPAGCDPNSVGINDPLDPIHDDICRMEVCDFAGNCSVCEPSPPLKYDDTTPCVGGAGGGLGKTADGVLCGECEPDDDDCHCIKGDASRCRDDGPVNCYTNPFDDRCPGFQNPACLADPFTPGCPVVNPCYPTQVYDGVICPRDAVRFCARNPYHYGCNLACDTGAIDCDPVPPGNDDQCEVFGLPGCATYETGTDGCPTNVCTSCINGFELLDDPIQGCEAIGG